MTRPEPLAHVAQLPRYVPGARGAAGAPTPIKLSSNENPMPPLPSVVEAIALAAGSINRYPDMFAVELTERIADAASVSPDRVAVGGGSVAVLAHLLQAFAGPGDEVVYAWRSFEAYPILTRALGATPVEVPLGPGFRHDLAAMSAAVTDRTKVVIVCSPNNPTGPAVTAGEFAQFMNDVPGHVLVILDEAYLEFVTDPNAVRGGAVLGRWDNLVVLRTFSKAYGLAGLRVGHALGPAEFMGAVRSCVTPFSVSGIAQAAALASLDAEVELLHRVSDIVAERERVVTELASAGWNLPSAEGNFFWLPVGDSAAELAAALGASTPALLVRPFAGDGVRVSIGARSQNDALVAALAQWQGRV
jgi:histidinol-phosphate aminotransferase